MRTMLHNIIALFCIATLCAVVVVHGVWISLPDISDPATLLAKQSLVIRDREGGELFRFYDEQDRTTITLDDVPQHLIDAFIAIEDKRYYERSCIDVRALSRAALANVTNYKSQGASTITQQLVRTALLGREKTVARKLKEILLACSMEWQYNKEEILSMYLNWISFGHGISGVQQASRRYFGIDAKDLTIAQSAALAALPQRPTYLSPYGPHKDELAERARLVLTLMKEQGALTQAEQRAAENAMDRIVFAPDTHPIRAPHFVLTLRDELRSLLQITEDVAVETTIDPTLQKLAEDTIAAALPKLRKTYNANNAALIAVDLSTNTVLAYVGNADYYDDTHAGQMDMARVPRQTGSAFKPFLYATLLQQPGYTTQSYIDDRPLPPSVYQPAHSGYYGRMTIATALARSRNIPAIRAFYLAGGEDVILRSAARFGIKTPLTYKKAITRTNPRFTYGWPLALGSAESSLLEMMQGFSVLAREGMYSPITAVRSVVHQERTLYSPKPSSSLALHPEIAQSLTEVLQNENARETLWRTSLKLPFGSAAVKTGTGNACRKRNLAGACTQILPNNNWTIGYAGDLLVGVWVGNANGTPMHDDSIALLTATPLWKQFFISVYDMHPTHLALQ